MRCDIPAEDVALLWPEDLDLYYVWNHDASVDENVAEIIRGFPALAGKRETLKCLAESALHEEKEAFAGELYLYSDDEDRMRQATTRARSLGVAYVVRRSGSGDRWEP